MVLPRTTLDKEPKRRNHDPINFHGTTKFILTKIERENKTQAKRTSEKIIWMPKKVIYATAKVNNYSRAEWLYG